MAVALNPQTEDTPLNREPPIKTLLSSFLTPTPISYDRNHGPIPHLSATHTIHVDGVGSDPLPLSVQQLQTEFPQHAVTCALECAGNRRHTMRTMLKEVQGIDWGDAAVMNCTWKGPRLRDILLRAGVDDRHAGRGLHVAFSSYQVPCQEDEWFGGSVELERCLGEEWNVIVALEMNGEPLPPNHGYPVRVVIPGVAGARWVKWLDRITVQEQESVNFYQRRDYKVLPPDAVDSASAEGFWDRTPAMCDMPINSVVGVPEDGERVVLSDDGMVEVKGYAVPQGADGPVTRVQVSGDGGLTWVDAELGGSAGERKWCWVLWRARVAVERGNEREILSRAFDAGGNGQVEHSQWNLRGVGYNGFGRARGLTVI
ncbi:Oxidoreductase, molybdopterin-binding domain-containing protein [Aspergillus avenaceus]|uniref:Oxidoreductase, molybdopterin-binding domain-containing protein n=1 Tax=Aspergillus avenaceus TaxID=36643 RepID=A0A5N6U854_ASPAV|nr:Oxidoreductase, molybdopterin-binding domain-containing protein [Aspergillus avenaceus]